MMSSKPCVKKNQNGFMKRVTREPAALGPGPYPSCDDSVKGGGTRSGQRFVIGSRRLENMQQAISRIEPSRGERTPITSAAAARSASSRKPPGSSTDGDDTKNDYCGSANQLHDRSVSSDADLMMLGEGSNDRRAPRQRCGPEMIVETSMVISLGTAEDRLIRRPTTSLPGLQGASATTAADLSLARDATNYPRASAGKYSV
jgi:hypothetical protein